MLVKSFSFLQTYHTRKEDTFDCIGELAGTLPKALRGEAFYELVYKVIDPLLEFKNRYDLGRQPEPLSYLNECLPQWREKLPLRIDDSPSAASFLDDLLVDVVRIKKEEASKINVFYRLTQTSNGWQIRSILSLQNGFYKPANLKIDEQAYEALSGKVFIKIGTNEADQLIGVGFKTGTGDLSIQGLQHYLLPPFIYQKPWRLLFTDAQTDFQAVVHLPFSDGFDERQPWVFSHTEEPELKGLGSTRLSTNQALVICPNDFIPKGEPEKIIHWGAFSPSQTLYAITGTYLFEDPQELRCFG
ncbi:hypothetical protein BWI93_16995 [Siphonobacter sp. BAB-5385]|uniref:hypothetical protein n=1 Tax=Siphonobacter sp. BAB-5385 TaxID=1864822 RepID=UPI000B9EC7B9|nr:hypothetical protein [Siphonobacter sp. BAB-5385]OZI07003.1 hypothetical protein BWI93_16995 [Siphonobacter sp. BAB-5385]